MCVTISELHDNYITHFSPKTPSYSEETNFLINFPKLQDFLLLCIYQCWQFAFSTFQSLSLSMPLSGSLFLVLGHIHFLLIYNSSTFDGNILLPFLVKYVFLNLNSFSLEPYICFHKSCLMGSFWPGRSLWQPTINNNYTETSAWLTVILTNDLWKIDQINQITSLVVVTERSLNQISNFVGWQNF